MRLYIKNMVCGRCKMVVKAELEKMQLHPVHVELGMIELEEKKLTEKELQVLTAMLNDLGFELLDDNKSRIIEKIKNVVVNLIHHTDDLNPLKYSEQIASELKYDYTYLSKLFSETEGITIEQYIIRQKIEKAKELLVYNELSLSQIADQLGYSSVAHLSAQFKKVTGLTPSFFKTLGPQKRNPLDEVGK